MTATFGFLRRQSLRVRITLAFVVTGAVLAVVLSASTYYAVRSFLESSRIRSATRQTIFGLLFVREFVSARPDRLEELTSLLQTREQFDAMVTFRNDWFSTALSLTPAALPAGLRALVAAERAGYEFSNIGGERVLVFGAPLPPQDTELYLFYALRDVDETLSLLARSLSLAGVAVVAGAAAVAQRVARRILQPLAAVSEAARRVAEGLLETRVEAATRDEVGSLASSFNSMASALQDMILRERRFVAGVSHELRTPLAALRATSDLLAAHRDELVPAAREAADLIAADVQSVSRLVEELMEVSEIDAGAAQLRWEEIDLRAAVEAIIAKRRFAARVEGSGARTFADKARLERIVGNLVDNAFQHGEGREVRVSVGVRDGVCELRIADRGPGIAAEDLPHLFDRFYKADRSRSRERGGVGLGLAIAAENARLLGGSIEAESRRGEGATFTVRIPQRVGIPEDVS